jgi:hypothetical protein
MKLCPRCNIEHNKPGTYCSRSCANSRIFTEESKRKRGQSFSAWYNTLSNEEKQDYNSKKTSGESWAKRRETLENKYLNLPFEDLSHPKKKAKILEEQQNACLHCGLTEWQGNPITFELDHIDGNRNHNVRSNLRALCPNCHSQTSTWRKGWKNYKES